MVSKTKPTGPWTYDAGIHFEYGWRGINKTAAEMMQIATNTYNVGVPTQTDPFTDEIEYENGKSMNYCYHVKNFIEEVEKCPMYGRLQGPFANGYCKVYAYSQTPAQFPVSPTLAEVTPTMRRLAWSKIEPSLNDGFSLTNFLWELKDIPSLLKAVRGFAVKAKNAFSITGFRKAASVSTASDLLLTYGFAIRPMMADIEKLYDDLMNTEKRVKEFAEAGREVKSYHHREIWDDNESDVLLSWGKLHYYTHHEYVATARLRYDYKRASEFENFCRVMGLRLTPSIVWEGIPFSFLIDYVLKIQDFLDQFDKDPLLTVEVLDYCDSIKSTAVCEISYSSSGTEPAKNLSFEGLSGWTVFVPEGDVLVRRCSKSIYMRQPGEPDMGYALPAFDSLSARELVFSGALAQAITRR